MNEAGSFVFPGNYLVWASQARHAALRGEIEPDRGESLLGALDYIVSTDYLDARYYVLSIEYL